MSIQAALIKGFLRLVRSLNPPPTELNLNKERAGLENMSRLFRPLAGFEVTPLTVDGVPAEWIIPPQVSDGRTILYFHGGYYLSGSINTHRNLAGNIAAAAKGRALIINYRLAPEHPFPAGLEDALMAYSWLIAHGTQPNQIFLVGDSAGGGLVLAALLAMRERGIPLPAGTVCLSPATDLTLSGDSWKTNAKKELVVSRSVAEQIPDLYLRKIDPHNPLASPLFGDLHGLPALLIQVGSDEVLLSDSTSFADRARAAGVNVKLEIWSGMFHVWQIAGSLMPESRQAISKIGEFIRATSQSDVGMEEDQKAGVP